MWISSHQFVEHVGSVVVVVVVAAAAVVVALVVDRKGLSWFARLSRAAFLADGVAGALPLFLLIGIILTRLID